jgi:hypothetical protein
MSEDYPGMIKEVEISMEEAKNAVARLEALRRLSEVDDFQLLITKGYFNLEAERVVGALADPAMIMNEVGMKMLENMVIGMGALRQYFLLIQTEGNRAIQALGELQDTHTELLQEDMAAES